MLERFLVSGMCHMLVGKYTKKGWVLKLASEIKSAFGTMIGRTQGNCIWNDDWKM